MKKETKQKNLLIGGLLAIVLIMAVGYAAFATQLNINGTANISNTWCMGFDSRNTNALAATAGVSGATVPTGSIAFSGDTCATNYKTDATLSANFKQPGDKIVYTLTIANKSTLTAAIKSIKVENQNVTSNTTITKGNIKYTVEMPESTTLAVDATTNMKVTAEFQNDTDINNYTQGEIQTLSVEINAEQDDGSGGFTPQPTTTTYYVFDMTGHSIGDTFDVAGLTPNTIPSGYHWFLKYVLNGTTIEEAWVCETFGVFSEPVCLRGGDPSYYGTETTGNLGILKELENNPSFTCEYNLYANIDVSCYGSTGALHLYNDGSVHNVSCHVYNDAQQFFGEQAICFD